jgi:chlorobactene glucosyltransferase
MDQFPYRDQIFHLIVFQAVLLLIVLSNAAILRKGGRRRAPRVFPTASVLVPARNEERNIARCVRSLLALDYPELQVLVLDDRSTDGTGKVLREIARSETRLQVLEGQPLPAGWLGKNWACAQLAAQATGELLYFTDADTVHEPHALCAAVAALEDLGADLLTGLPQQVVRTWGERLIVPIFGWAFYCFTPLALAYRLKLPALSIAVGQMMLFRRTAYRAIGGHAAVRASIVEDMSLARQIKAHGLRWRVIDACSLVRCRMYHDSRAAYAGLCKNLFPAFGSRLIPFAFVWVWLAILFLKPPIMLVLSVLGLVPGAHVWLLVCCTCVALALWLTVYRRLGYPSYLALLYPVTLVVVEFVALSSLWLTLTGRLTWKGRTLIRPRWKWL